MNLPVTFVRSMGFLAATAALGAVGCGGSAKLANPATPELTAAEVKPAPARCEPKKGSGRFDVLVLGSGGTGDRARAGSGFVVLLDGQARILVDAGSGTFKRLREAQVDVTLLDTVLVTHLHGDHVDDLDEFLEHRANVDGPVAVRLFGPAGAGRHAGTRVFVERVFGREGGLATKRGVESRLRVDATDVEKTIAPRVLFRDGDLAVSAISVDHGDVPTLAYRIQRGPRSVVFSGDLAGRNDSLAQLARSTDLLVHDAAVLDPGAPAPAGSAAQARIGDRSSVDEAKADRMYELHSTPSRIGRVASQAPVGELLLTHLSPSVRMRQSAVLDSIRSSFGGDVRFAEDCQMVKVGP